MTARLCRACGHVITPDWPGEWHVGCYPDFERMPGFDMTTWDLELREELIDVVLWAERNRGRSTQVALGVSEVGQDCELRIAYRMAGMQAVQNGDPWPAIVGTSIHTWMDQAFNDYQNVHGIREWLTELEVAPSPIVHGHTDLYHIPRRAVLDWKFPGSDNLRKMRQQGPSAQYRTQVQLYGLGHVRAGRPVERVGIVALGRQGWLKDMYVWTEAYDEDFARKALDRIYRLGDKMMALGLPDSGAWQEIERSPTYLCRMCPFWNYNEKMPSNKGCPGK
jgi:hypothetical protein